MKKGHFYVCLLVLLLVLYVVFCYFFFLIKFKDIIKDDGKLLNISGKVVSVEEKKGKVLVGLKSGEYLIDLSLSNKNNVCNIDIEYVSPRKEMLMVNGVLKEKRVHSSARLYGAKECVSELGNRIGNETVVGVGGSRKSTTEWFRRKYNIIAASQSYIGRFVFKNNIVVRDNFASFIFNEP